MKQQSQQCWVALIGGATFGAGLTLSGMTQPAKVIGFLDVTGNWDPSLAFVMAGAVFVHYFAYRNIRTRTRPLLAERFSIPVPSDVDRRLLAGAALFGVGWGLVGYCPGPALTSLVTGGLEAWVFVICMIVGMGLTTLIQRLATERGPPLAGKSM